MVLERPTSYQIPQLYGIGWNSLMRRLCGLPLQSSLDRSNQGNRYPGSERRPYPPKQQVAAEQKMEVEAAVISSGLQKCRKPDQAGQKKSRVHQAERRHQVQYERGAGA
ncbi:hypothetical protein NDU88_009121 [Pleurodeles waltl]|uniref:Uncharacterized protein n=1 Tax=Pleurodeles waltl TaxID=8319 RepID=A0AAV7PWD7_PLEWA|nr:hypothetical protein NDU88_009121 [Pleurodeles waltl]